MSTTSSLVGCSTARRLLLIAGLALAMSGLAMRSSSATTDQVRHVRLHRAGLAIDVALSNRPVHMAPNFRSGWSIHEAPLVITANGKAAPMTTWAMPAFGAARSRQRPVTVTYLIKAQARGDREFAEPLYPGSPLRPQPYRASGYRDLAVPIGNHLALLVRMTVRDGYARTALEFPSQPDKNIISGQSNDIQPQ